MTEKVDTSTNRNAMKQRAILWKKQLKGLKVKDMCRKIEAVRFCAQDEEFFREQSDVFPILMGFLSKTKTPDLVMETLITLHNLLSPPTVIESDAKVIQHDLNAKFILGSGVHEPIIKLFSLKTLAPEIRVKAIKVFELQFQASVTLSTPALLHGLPFSDLIHCLAANDGDGDLQFTALLCLGSLTKFSPTEDSLETLESLNGLSHVFEFISHSQRRFHRPALDILDTFSHLEYGRKHLETNKAVHVFQRAIEEALELVQKTSSLVLVSGISSSPLTVQDASLLLSNFPILCQVFVRLILAPDHVVSTNTLVRENIITVMNAMIGMLRFDLKSALKPVIEHTRTPTGHAAALASLFPFHPARCVAIISSLGRMLESNEEWKASAKSQDVLSLVLDCYKVREAASLYQVADKILHVCIQIRDMESLNDEIQSQKEQNNIDKNDDLSVQTPDFASTFRIDPQILQSIGLEDVKPALVPVETLLSLLTASYEPLNRLLLFRHLRWIARLMESPANAKALGERGISLLLDIFATLSVKETVLCALLAKCIEAIVLQSSSALELCGSPDKNPVPKLLQCLEQISPESSEAKELGKEEKLSNEIQCQDESMERICPLEWIDEFETHNADDSEVSSPLNVLLEIAQALKGLSDAILKWNVQEEADASPLEPGKPESDAVSSGKATSKVQGSKKNMVRNPSKPSITGENVVMGMVEKGRELLHLISNYAVVQPTICVELLGLLSNLMTIPSGKTGLLDHIKSQIQTTKDGDVSNVEGPGPAQFYAQMEHTFFLEPVLNLLSSCETSWIEIKAAVQLLAVMTSESTSCSSSLLLPADDVKKESESFVTAALASGALVVLLALMDEARLPRASHALPHRKTIFKTQVQEMVLNFIILTQEKMENENRSQLLDLKLNIQRFGNVSYSALVLATELNELKIVSALVQAGASLETSSVEGLTPLMIAFLLGNEEMITKLLQAGANVDAMTTDGRDITVWNCALVTPVKTCVNDMITTSYYNVESIEGSWILSMKSLMDFDAIQGSIEYLNTCLDAGVDVNVSNASGNYLLHAILSNTKVRCKLRGRDICFRYNSLRVDPNRLKNIVVDLIQTHSADINSCNRLGHTPLHLALLYGYPTIVKLLLTLGANPNIQSIHGLVPIHYACLGFCGNSDGTDREAITIIQLLLNQARKFPHFLGTYSDTRKHKSKLEKHALSIEEILEQGRQNVMEPPSIVLKRSNGHEMLTTRSFEGNFFPWHFACGAYVQLSSGFGLEDEMQQWLTTNGRVRATLLRFLHEEWNVDVTVPASQNVTALHLAVKSDRNQNNVPVLDFLLENATAAFVNAVHDDILIDTLPVLPIGSRVTFHSLPGFVSSRSVDGKYRIILADGRQFTEISRDQVQVIDNLDEKEGTVPYDKYLLPIESRFTALHYAMQLNDDTLALRFLARADISLHPEGSDVPLLALACAAQQTAPVVKQLITTQANMRVQLPLRQSKQDGMTGDVELLSSRKHAAALHYAVMYEDVAVVEALLTHPDGHVQPNVRRSQDGFTPLHLACQVENMTIVKLLLDNGADLMQLSSTSTHGVSPFQLLLQCDSMENEKLQMLIQDKYLRPEMLLEGGIKRQEASTTSENSYMPSCALLLEEEENLNLFERLERLKLGPHGAQNRQVIAKLEKSDAVLDLFFDLLKQPSDATSSLMETFQLLDHPHECYQQFMTRSSWKSQLRV